MPFRTPLWRAVTLLALTCVAFFGTAAVVITVRSDDSTARVAGATSPPQSARTESSATATVPHGTAAPPTTPSATQPATTDPPAPPPAPDPDPEPAPAPAPVPAQRAENPVASQSATVAAAPAEPAPAPEPVTSSCQSLSAGSLIAAHQSVHAFGVDGGLSAAAQAFALTLCNAHVEDNLFHSGQAAGENLAWVQSTGGCVNDGNLVVQAWLGSPAHRANLDRFTVVGGGVACDGTNAYFVAQYR